MLWDGKFSCHDFWKCTVNELKKLSDVRNPFIVGNEYPSGDIQAWCEEYENDQWIEITDTAFDSYDIFMFYVSDNGEGVGAGLWFEKV